MPYQWLQTEIDNGTDSVRSFGGHKQIRNNGTNEIFTLTLTIVDMGALQYIFVVTNFFLVCVCVGLLVRLLV